MSVIIDNSYAQMASSTSVSCAFAPLIMPVPPEIVDIVAVLMAQSTIVKAISDSYMKLQNAILEHNQIQLTCDSDLFDNIGFEFKSAACRIQRSTNPQVYTVVVTSNGRKVFKILDTQKIMMRIAAKYYAHNIKAVPIHEGANYYNVIIE